MFCGRSIEAIELFKTRDLWDMAKYEIKKQFVQSNFGGQILSTLSKKDDFSREKSFIFVLKSY